MQADRETLPRSGLTARRGITPSSRIVMPGETDSVKRVGVALRGSLERDALRVNGCSY